MSATSSLFYFSMMGIFLLEGWFFSVALPFHRAVNEAEAQASRQLPLDGLRGVLAFSIFFCHACGYYFYLRTGVWALLPSNFGQQMAVFPVTMFFFITGYLFWTKLMRGRPEKTGAFWLGRLARLGPAYWASCVLLFICAAVASDFNRRVPMASLAGQLFSWMTFRAGKDINGVVGSNLWLGVAWTLRFEWLFYLSIPFLAWFARRRWRTLMLLATVFILSRGTAPFAIEGTGLPAPVVILAKYVQYFATIFSIGILVAILPKKRFARWAQGTAATLLSLSILGFAVYRATPEYGLSESAVLAIPFSCVCLGNTWFGLLSSRGLRFLGRISYSFYLFHVLVLTIILNSLGARIGLASLSPILYWAIAAGCGTATILLSAFTYEYFEAPFLHVRRQRLEKEATPTFESNAIVPMTEIN
jgi:peptidoglycan/LPS O-acetylase OafA/YrhL